MSRIAAKFESLRAQGRKALIPYVTAGDPKPGITVSIMHAMVEAGADIIELGVPFSDPMADGPVIQRASERALVHHTSLRDVMAMVREFRTDNQGTPVVLMGYLNPIEVMGYEIFAAAAEEAGVDAALTVDIPPEEAGELLSALEKHGLNAIFLVAPTSIESRIETICKVASGFVYYVSLKGVTGASNLDLDAVKQKLDEIRKATDLPIGVGFGIKDAATAAAVSQVADAVVVGSALVNQVEALADTPDAIAPALAASLVEMRQAMDAIN